MDWYLDGPRGQFFSPSDILFDAVTPFFRSSTIVFDSCSPKQQRKQEASLADTKVPQTSRNANHDAAS
ncbi:hypothetical protein LMH87_004656 [Akanthomyces muscarius]|uniref:Uncharacterized protein n=1 Tax=Akanthomyces muscarius TaxID=2231603 RepID=A0A9W8Q5S7_AKAMU|nr:hypothetical protein LMH87_004656 [Akanthomyces muscarius]KAJ4145824.1 hypothetical protein LMH87_004656 [Akanthomyces muscarius]